MAPPSHGAVARGWQDRVMTTKTRQIQLASRPQGWPTHDNFDLVPVELPTRDRARSWSATR